MAKPTTYITFLLDRTGSMQSIKKATIDGFNEFVNGQKTAKVKGDMTLTIFDSESIDVLYTNPVKDVPVLTSDDFVPRAMTPLFDGIGRTIRNAKDRLAAETKQPDTVIVVIMTDGLENASSEFKIEDVRALVKEQEEAGWKFVFLGANMDAYAEGMNLGMENAQYVTYSATEDSTLGGMAYASASVGQTIASRGATWTSQAVDVDEKGKSKKRSTPLP